METGRAWHPKLIPDMHCLVYTHGQWLRVLTYVAECSQMMSRATEKSEVWISSYIYKKKSNISDSDYESIYTVIF